MLFNGAKTNALSTLMILYLSSCNGDDDDDDDDDNGLKTDDDDGDSELR